MISAGHLQHPDMYDLMALTLLNIYVFVFLKPWILVWLSGPV